MKQRISANWLALSLCITLPTLVHGAGSCPELSPAATAQLEKQGAKLSHTPQTDYARIHHSSNCYLEAWPTTTIQMSALVKTAYQLHIPIRTQGGSHSQNGSSLPQQSELLIHTNALNTIKLLSPNEILTGSGVPVAIINQYIADYDMKIPVFNDGQTSGPTVGGFISAGGVHPASSIYGGFWDQVNEITLVSGNGKIFHVRTGDSLFPWLFGSMGQFGIITEAKLKTISTNFNVNEKSKFKAGAQLRIDFKNNGGRYHLESKNAQSILWLVLFVAPDQLNEAMNDLSQLENKYGTAMQYAPLLQYMINTQSAPPLIFKNKNSFYLITIWGNKINNAANLAQFEQLNNDYAKLAASKKYNRYIQAEFPGSPEIYKEYFNNTVYTDFKKIKSQMDPEFLFNAGSVFPIKDKRSSK
jgi:FAD/FMN-containing dehydrogenase